MKNTKQKRDWLPFAWLIFVFLICGLFFAWKSDAYSIVSYPQVVSSPFSVVTDASDVTTCAGATNFWLAGISTTGAYTELASSTLLAGSVLTYTFPVGDTASTTEIDFACGVTFPTVTAQISQLYLQADDFNGTYGIPVVAAGSATTSTSTVQTVDNPTLDYEMGVVTFLMTMAGTIWFFRRSKV